MSVVQVFFKNTVRKGQIAQGSIYPFPTVFSACLETFLSTFCHNIVLNKKAHLQNFSSLKLDGVEIWYLVCGISLWISTKFVHKMPLGSKLAPPWGSQVEHRNEEGKFHNSSTLKLEGLELWYFVCSISLWICTKIVHMMPLGSGLVLLWGSQVGAQEQRRQITEFFFFESGRPRPLIFCMYYLQVNLYQVSSFDVPGVKSGPVPGSLVGT